MISFPDAIKRFFQRYTDFQGRSSRAEYWWVWLMNFGIMFGLGVIGAMLSLGDPEAGVPLVVMIPLSLYFLAIFVPSLALLVRRLHDIDKSGWLVLPLVLSAIPLVGFLVTIAYIVVCCLPGTPGPNRFGEAPVAEPGATAEFGTSTS